MEAQLQLTPEEIKALANNKLDSLRGEAQDVACESAWSRVMGLSTIVAAGMAVTLPIGGMAGLLGIGAWGIGAVSVAIGGVIFAWREGQGIYSGDSGTLDRWLPDEDWAALANRAEQVKLAAEEALKKPTGAVELFQAANNQSLENTECSQTEPSTGSPEAATTAPTLLPIAPCQLDDAAPHLLLIGRTREGKSETLKHLIGSEDRVWYITSKYTDQVPEHWKAYRVGGQDLPAQMAWILAKWEAQIDRHLSGKDTAREWFVVDEAVGIMQSLKTKGDTKADRDQNTAIAGKLKALIIELVTAGAAVGAFVGLLSQTGNSGPLGVDLDLLKNFSVVSCGKRKKAQMITSFEKLTQLKLTPDQQAQTLALAGFWQLWENEGPTLSQVPMSPLPLAPVGLGPTSDYDAMRTPTPDNPDTVDWAAVAQQLLEQPADYGMKRAARAVTGRNLAGPTWQAWRDEFVAVVKTLDPDLQDNLVQRFEAVLG